MQVELGGLLVVVETVVMHSNHEPTIAGCSSSAKVMFDSHKD
jgi:hypothetical protein